MNKTKIEWVRNKDGTQGYTWNPVTGCLGPDGNPENPKRCTYCYAHKLARGRLKSQYLGIPPYPDDLTPALLVPGTDKSDPFVPRFWRHRLKEPFRHRKPCTIFVCSMGELFNEHYPASWLGNILHTFYECPQHRFLVLTKNPPRDEKICLPRNVWLGVSINKSEDWHRLSTVNHYDVHHRFISFEPLLDDVFKDPKLAAFHGFPYIDWVIIGAQTQPCLKPDHDWVYNIIDRAKHEGIPVFVKNNLRWAEKIEEMPR